MDANVAYNSTTDSTTDLITDSNTEIVEAVEVVKVVEMVDGIESKSIKFKNLLRIVQTKFALVLYLSMSVKHYYIKVWINGRNFITISVKHLLHYRTIKMCLFDIIRHFYIIGLF